MCKLGWILTCERCARAVLTWMGTGNSCCGMPCRAAAPRGRWASGVLHRGLCGMASTAYRWKPVVWWLFQVLCLGGSCAPRGASVGRCSARPSVPGRWPRACDPRWRAQRRFWLLRALALLHPRVSAVDAWPRFSGAASSRCRVVARASHSRCWLSASTAVPLQMHMLDPHVVSPWLFKAFLYFLTFLSLFIFFFSSVLHLTHFLF